MIDVNGANVRCTPLLVPHKSPQHRRPVASFHQHVCEFWALCWWYRM